MQYQLKKGSFVPEKFEVSFSVLEELDAVNIALSEQEKWAARQDRPCGYERRPGACLCQGRGL